MIITIGLILLTACAVLVDRYIYRRFVAPAASLLLRRIYLVYAVVCDACVWAFSLLYKFSDNVSELRMHVVMWVIFFFMINALPKTLFVLISLLGRKGGKRRIFTFLGAVAAAAMFGVLVWGATVGRSTVRVNELTLSSERLPAAFDGLRVVLFSDVHVGSLTHKMEMLEKLVATVNSLDADIVVNAGDLANIRCTELTPEVMNVLSGIRSRYGVYAVMGNHDLGFYIKDTVALPAEVNVERIAGAQRAIGWKMLINETDYLRIGGDSIAISGVNYPQGYHHNGHNSKMSGVDFDRTYDGVPEDIYNLTVSHAPQLWHELMEHGRSDLTLSGHTHSMQVKVRMFGRYWSPARMNYREWSGLYGKEGRYLYINDGYGCVGFPMRLGAYPEVTLITLRR